jgi:hypothetical protein
VHLQHPLDTVSIEGMIHRAGAVVNSLVVNWVLVSSQVIAPIPV